MLLKLYLSLAQRAEREGRIVGVKVAEQAPSVCHLLFADDTRMLFQAEEGQATEVRRVLDAYARASGQYVSGRVDQRKQLLLRPPSSFLGLRCRPAICPHPQFLSNGQFSPQHNPSPAVR
ncbi:hypothetical protein Sango_2976100 [Sesamum angolense]|uniref:Reverse transcriptase domain-containing protein n=1 Tax=Sesamum angolense TaxID=2727404 RepID=A0AAE1T523_9LAMI|nr:hypothetical protein Sango_2976100 [Sesamum angolense]